MPSAISNPASTSSEDDRPAESSMGFPGVMWTAGHITATKQPLLLARPDVQGSELVRTEDLCTGIVWRELGDASLNVRTSGFAQAWAAGLQHIGGLETSKVEQLTESAWREGVIDIGQRCSEKQTPIGMIPFVRDGSSLGEDSGKVILGISVDVNPSCEAGDTTQLEHVTLFEIPVRRVSVSEEYVGHYPASFSGPGASAFDKVGTTILRLRHLDWSKDDELKGLGLVA